MENNNYKELKQEFTRESFRKKMVSSLGNTCYNCGSQENIEYHHIVPLKVGGTNRLTNIVPLCHRCHEASHIGRHRNDLRSKTNRGGRPKKWELTDQREEALWKWARGEIGTAQLRNILDMGNRVHIKETDMYTDFIDKHGICDIKNVYDMVSRKVKFKEKRKTSTIYFKGHVEEYEAEVGEQIPQIKPYIIYASGCKQHMVVKDGQRHRMGSRC